MKLIYICGLGHSGSTILDMVLGCHSRIIGLGEVHNIISASKNKLNDKKFTKIKCSCGKDMNECIFWSNVKNVILNYKESSMLNRYLKLISIFKNIFGSDKMLVDSSKNTHSYLMQLNQQVDLKVIFLVRDFRSWSHSINLKQGKRLIFLPYQWFKHTIKTTLFLRKMDVKYLKIGYEELALYPRKILPIITDFLEIDYDDNMTIPNKTKSHIIRGNTLRGDSQKTLNIQYDARWMTAVSSSLLSCAYFPLLFVNRKYVYSNFIKPKTYAFGKKQDDFLIFSNKETENLINKGFGQKK